MPKDTTVPEHQPSHPHLRMTTRLAPSQALERLDQAIEKQMPC
jgi:hypothetical protein